MLLIGDIHANTNDYLKLIERYGGEPSVQVGDFGMGFGAEKAELPKGAWFFRGNHDNPDLCNQSFHCLGDYGEREVDGVKFFFLAGAWSIDWQQRLPGRDWWFKEELSIVELNRALELYCDTKPDIVLSHDGPDQATIVLSSMVSLHKPLAPTRTGQALTAMFLAHQPAKWIFGHWHARWRAQIGRTEFRCLAPLGWCQIHGDFAKRKKNVVSADQAEHSGTAR